MFKRKSILTALHLPAVLLICTAWAVLAALPLISARADGGGFPTDTPRPPTPTATLAAGKGLGSTTSLATSTPTVSILPQSAANTPLGGAPAPSSGQSVAPAASGETAPVSGSPSGTTSSGSGFPMLAIIGLAALATLGVVVLLLLLRRRG